jgi:toxin ParE1/3/4
MSGKAYHTLRADLRGIPFKGHIIFYRQLEDGLEILRVISSRRNLSNLFAD